MLGYCVKDSLIKERLQDLSKYSYIFVYKLLFLRRENAVDKVWLGFRQKKNVVTVREN